MRKAFGVPLDTLKNGAQGRREMLALLGNHLFIVQEELGRSSPQTVVHHEEYGDVKI